MNDRLIHRNGGNINNKINVLPLPAVLKYDNLQ